LAEEVALLTQWLRQDITPASKFVTDLRPLHTEPMDAGSSS
jgi:hypothetical protein